MALAVTCVLTVAALTACEDFPTPFQRQHSESEAVQNRDIPALLLYVPQGTSAEDQALGELVDSLNALNPSVEISATISADYDADLAAALASDRPPDVFLVTGSRLPELAESGVLAPISAQWIERGQLLNAAAQGIEIDGTFFCFPHSIHTLGLLYNVDRFDAAGVPHPSAEWDWDDLARAAAALTDDEAGTVGLVLDPSPLTWVLFYLQAGGELLQEARGSVFASGPGRTAADYMAGLFAEGVAATPEQLGAMWSGEAFASGTAAMTIAGDWIAPYLSGAPLPFTYSVAELPGGPVREANIAFTSCLAVHAQSANLDLALQLADQLTAPEVLPRWAGADGDPLSVYIGDEVVAQPASSLMAPYLRALRYATPWTLGDMAERLGARFEDGLIQVSDDDLDVDEFWPYLLSAGLPTTAP